MIYQQASVVINTDIDNAWNYLKKAMTTSETLKIFDGCNSIEIVSDAEGQIKRTLKFDDRSEEETVTVNFTSFRVNSLITNNQTYLGEISYCLLKPTEAFLSEKHCSLVIISAWRMHPGVYAAPILDKSSYINAVANNLKNEIETPLTFI